MRAIILAGGLGTRLKSVISNSPKVMAPVSGVPFLNLILDDLARQGFSEVYLALGFLANQIKEYYSDTYKGMSLYFQVEKHPLGTGGALKNILVNFSFDEPVFVLNGDSLVELSFSKMFAKFQDNYLTMAVVEVSDCNRYGRVVLNEDKVLGFSEKGFNGSGLINAGVYLFNPQQISLNSYPEVFSLETDLFPGLVKSGLINSYEARGGFVDIGTPESYYSFVGDYEG